MKIKSIITTKTIATALSFLFVSVPFLVFADSVSGIANPLNPAINNIPILVSTILGYVVKIGGVIAVFMFIWTGFLYIKAQGNPTELASAHKAFFGTCIGVAVLLGAQLIASIIVGTINGLK